MRVKFRQHVLNDCGVTARAVIIGEAGHAAGRDAATRPRPPRSRSAYSVCLTHLAPYAQTSSKFFAASSFSRSA